MYLMNEAGYRSFILSSGGLLVLNHYKGLFHREKYKSEPQINEGLFKCDADNFGNVLIYQKNSGDRFVNKSGVFVKKC